MSTNSLARGLRWLLFLFLSMVPVAGLAQSISESFEELRRDTVQEFWRGDEPVVKEGDTVWITYVPSGQTEPLEQEGRVVRLTESAITVTVDNAEIELPESRVRQIEWRRKETILNGLAIGAAAGVGVGLLMAASVCEGGLFGADCESGGVYAALGGIGGVIGSGLGALADRSKKAPPLLIYRVPRTSTSSFSLTVVPVLSKERKGVVFSVAW